MTKNTDAAIRDQNDPGNGQQDVATALIDDINARIDLGVKIYGKRLETFNGRDALVDAYQEAIDHTLYLKQKLIEDDAMQKYHWVFLSIMAHLNEAAEKHPENKEIYDPIHAASFVAEEAGELVQAANDIIYDNGNVSDAIEEAFQTCAVAVRFILGREKWERTSEEAKNKLSKGGDLC